MNSIFYEFINIDIRAFPAKGLRFFLKGNINKKILIPGIQKNVKFLYRVIIML
jgi:hypothetical protein